ncbi:UspA domain-containing protein [Solidesulfovibrio carbinoliphilus subsp. oakridgensis]|uniref:UspA domain-containing protein n=1 Tax=Solidesulfovibrio carbinoliphilus subsp. oakridgensis TaxID=694327 RepID=G7Q4Y4_9BACT|nr:universal stress protein [Solidesulfovibrio carbinoliphilus]EHJ47911.1 UspA domain-containing protein [Solidesulfovibrio carbinoliphilus subsp. oakridgensis]
MKKCIVCLDGSQPSLRALDRALTEADCGETDILAVTVVEALTFFDCDAADFETTFAHILREPKKILAEAVEFAAGRGVAIRTLAVPGRPAETVARIAREEGTDEIYLGSRGKDDVEHLLLGSVSTRLVQIAPCTVIVVR